MIVCHRLRGNCHYEIRILNADAIWLRCDHSYCGTCLACHFCQRSHSGQLARSACGQKNIALADSRGVHITDYRRREPKMEQAHRQPHDLQSFAPRAENNDLFGFYQVGYPRINLSKDNRKKVQSILSDLGFYKSSNDGLYGKETSAALTAYMKKNLNDDDLTNSGNVIKLITVLLDIETSPTPALLRSKD